jgi:tRNA (cytidine/uridine-2'-O-)-methyltransferase
MPTDPILHVVLHQPEIPANTGAVGRTCVAAGAKLWLVRPLGFRLDDRQMRRAGLDYWKHLQCEVVDDWSDLVRHLPEAERKPWLLTKSAMKAYTEAPFESADVLVFGSETRGLPLSLLAAYPDRLLRIPMRPEARSLNLSVSAGVVVYEALRQIHAGRR